MSMASMNHYHMCKYVNKTFENKYQLIVHTKISASNKTHYTYDTLYPLFIVHSSLHDYIYTFYIQVNLLTSFLSLVTSLKEVALCGCILQICIYGNHCPVVEWVADTDTLPFLPTPKCPWCLYCVMDTKSDICRNDHTFVL